MEFLKDYKKIRLQKNKKEPLFKWSDTNTHFKNECPNFQYGILTGNINNIIVIDIDSPKNDKFTDGFTEILKYEQAHGKINTLSVTTPNKGMHYYFKLPKKNLEYDKTKYLTNRTHYRGATIDIRSNGGYIVGPGSSINGFKYEIVNKTKIQEIPETLINFLLETTHKEFETLKKQQQFICKDVITNNIVYDMTDEAIKTIINLLDDNYKVVFSKWLIVATALKNLNKYNIFDEWSKGVYNYNEEMNKIIYNNIHSNIDINYLIHQLKQGGHNINYVQGYKPLIHKYTTDNKIKKLEINAPHLMNINNNHGAISYEMFKNNEVLIIKSCTGTGKTSCIAKYTKNMMQTDPEIKILTITDKIILSIQHIDSFKKANIQLLDYRETSGPIFGDDNITICINSIKRLFITPDELNKTIIYIDEIASFLNLTHNKIINPINREIIKQLKYIIENAYKVIVSDNFLNDGVFKLLEKRDKTKTLFINNTFQKYKNIDAERVKNEDDFKNKLIEQIKDGNYFFFGSDSKRIIDNYYNSFIELFKNNEEITNKMYLITSDGITTGGQINKNLIITDASEQFNNKFIFHSPAITSGLDFTITSPQSVFIHITGESIRAPDILQQTTRTRNINKVFYYSNAQPKTPQYNCIDKLRTLFNENINVMTNINNSLYGQNLCNNCKNCKECKEEDLFNELYFINEYNNDALETSIIKHYEELLKNAGFTIINNNINVQPLPAEVKKEMKNLTTETNEKNFMNYLKAGDEDNTTELIKKDFKKYEAGARALNIDNKDTDTLIKYKDIIINEHKRREHKQILKFLMSDDILGQKNITALNYSFNLTATDSDNNKIMFIREICNKYGLSYFNNDINKDNINEYLQDINYNVDEFNNIKKIFKRLKQDRPKNKYELVKLINSLYRTTAINNLFVSQQIRITGQKLTIYTLNKDVIIPHLELYKIKSSFMTGLHDDIYTMFNVETPPKNNNEDVFNYLDN